VVPNPNASGILTLKKKKKEKKEIGHRDTGECYMKVKAKRQTRVDTVEAKEC
jgi:hypothetical protein